MGDDIPFDRSFDLPAGRIEEVMPGLRRLLADNPSPFTFKGTVSYIVGRGRVAILDPGPEDEQHISRLLDAVRGETVTHVVVTHTHRDHSPAAARIKAATGAILVAEGPHRAARPLHLGENQRLEASADLAFRPDLAIPDGASVTGAGWTLEAVATPGHTANHMAYAYKEAGVLFSGDHVMAWSTPVVAPPDGAMGDYMASLNKLSERPETTYFPGHGSCRSPRVSFSFTSDTGGPAKLRFSVDSPKARPISRPSSARSISDLIRASWARPGSRCWRILRICMPAGSSRPTGSPRSPASIVWSGPEVFSAPVLWPERLFSASPPRFRRHHRCPR